MKLEFSKNTGIPNFIKVSSLGGKFFHTDGRTDRQTDVIKLSVVFRNVADVPTMTLLMLHSALIT